ncbi:MAG: hypothetical protein ABW202_11425, partial [Duganella sp.]
LAGHARQFQAPRDIAMTTIPLLTPGILITPYQQADGEPPRYLLELGDRHFLISPNTRALVLALAGSPVCEAALEAAYLSHGGTPLPAAQLVAQARNALPAALFADAAPSTGRAHPFTISLQLLSPRHAGAVSSRLAWLFTPALAWPLVALFIALHACTLPEAMRTAHMDWSGGVGAQLTGLLLLSGLIHELGHSAACRYFGCTHGAIGFGLYLIFPAWYADVSKAWRLAPRQRAVVDLGGVYFQALLLIGIDLYALASGSALAYKLTWLITFTMLFTLNPVFKFDGYWLLSDLSGLHNLHRQVRSAAARLLLRLLGRAPAAPVAPILLAYGLMSGAYMMYFISYLVMEIRRMGHTLPGAVSDGLHHLQFAGGEPSVSTGMSAGAVTGELLWAAVISSACIFLAAKIWRSVVELRQALVQARTHH